MTVRIRRAGKQDIEMMIPMLSELFSIETDFVIDAEKQRAGLSLLLSDSDKRIVFVAADDTGDIAGMVTAQLVASTAAGGYGALLEDMFVCERYRRSGVGKSLLTAVKDWASEKGAKRIQLLADRRNRPALVFYTGHHFSESSMRGFYLKLNE